MGCSPRGRKESDMTERLHFHFLLFMHWRRKWQATPVFLPRESQGRGSLVDCCLWGCTELDRTEATEQQQQQQQHSSPHLPPSSAIIPHIGFKGKFSVGLPPEVKFSHRLHLGNYVTCPGILSFPHTVNA